MENMSTFGPVSGSHNYIYTGSRDPTYIIHNVCGSSGLMLTTLKDTVFSSCHRVNHRLIQHIKMYDPQRHCAHSEH